MSGAAGRVRQSDEVCARNRGVRLLEVASDQVDECGCDRYEVGCRAVECGDRAAPSWYEFIVIAGFLPQRVVELKSTVALDYSASVLIDVRYCRSSFWGAQHRQAERAGASISGDLSDQRSPIGRST